VQWVWLLTDEKHDEYVVKETFCMNEYIIDQSRRKRQGCKESQVQIQLLRLVGTRGLAVRNSMWLGVDLQVSNASVRICVELRSVLEPERDTALL
jgi:hypothetical protein